MPVVGDIKINFSKKAKRKYIFFAIVFLFVIYFPIISFIEQYLYFDKKISLIFFFEFLILFWVFCLLIFFSVQAFKKTALTITEDGIIINYYFFGNHFLSKSEFDTINVKYYKGKEYIVFYLTESYFKNRNKSPLLKILKPTKNKELLFLSDDLEGNSKEMIDKIYGKVRE